MKFKRILAAGVSAAAVLGMAACGGGGSSADDNTIVFWTNATAGDGRQYWEDFAAAFESEHEGVTVQIEAIQNEDYEGKLTTAMQDLGSGPDVFMTLGGQKDRDMIAAGQLMDLTDKISDTVKTQMAAALDSVTYDGKIYGVPVTVQPGGIWYSKDLFAQAGITEVPTTWEELMDACQKLKDAGIDPIAVGAKDAWPAAHWYYWLSLRICSPDVYDESMANKDFSAECWTAAGEKLQELNDAGYFNEGYLTTTAQQGASSSAGLLANHKAAMELMGTWEPGVVRDLTPDQQPMADLLTTTAQQGASSSAGLLANHKAAMELMGTWEPGVVRDLTPDQQPMADLGFFAFPSIEDGEGEEGALMGSATSNGVNPEAPEIAIDFVNKMAEKEWQDKFATAFSTIPASAESQADVEDESLAGLIEALNASDGMKLWMDTSLGANIGTALNTGVVNMLSGTGTPEDLRRSTPPTV